MSKKESSLTIIYPIFANPCVESMCDLSETQHNAFISKTTFDLSIVILE